MVGMRLGGKRLVKQSLAWSRCSVDASHSLNIEMTVPSPAGDAATSQPVVMSQPATGPVSCWAASPPFPSPPPTTAHREGALFHRCQAARSTSSK